MVYDSGIGSRALGRNPTAKKQANKRRAGTQDHESLPGVEIGASVVRLGYGDIFYCTEPPTFAGNYVGRYSRV